MPLVSSTCIMEVSKRINKIHQHALKFHIGYELLTSFKLTWTEWINSESLEKNICILI